MIIGWNVRRSVRSRRRWPGEWESNHVRWEWRVTGSTDGLSNGARAAREPRRGATGTPGAGGCRCGSWDPAHPGVQRIGCGPHAPGRPSAGPADGARGTPRPSGPEDCARGRPRRPNNPFIGKLRFSNTWTRSPLVFTLATHTVPRARGDRCAVPHETLHPPHAAPSRYCESRQSKHACAS